MQSLFTDESDPGRSQAVIKIGEVSSVDPSKATARVVFDDDDSLVSGELQVLQLNSLMNKGYWLPDVGEDVVCLFMGTGLEEGFIIGATYAGDVMPPENDQDIRETKFKDENFIFYNRRDHVLSIKVNDVTVVIKPEAVEVKTSGVVNVEAGSQATIKAPKVLLDTPETECTGSLKVAGGISGGGGIGASIQGPVTATEDVKAGSVSLQGHTHTGDSGGTTSPPN